MCYVLALQYYRVWFITVSNFFFLLYLINLLVVPISRFGCGSTLCAMSI